MPRKKKEQPDYIGRAVDFTGSDGIKRRVALHRGPGSRVHLAWETWWEGEEKEPFRTEVLLSLPALNATMSLLAELQACPELYTIPNKQ